MSSLNKLKKKFKGLVPEEIIEKKIRELGPEDAEKFFDKELERHNMNTWVFLKYAIPSFESYACSMAANIRGEKRSKEDLENAIKHVTKGEPLEKPIEKLFPFAVNTLRALAMGKPVTDKKIREYFLIYHRGIVEENPVHKTEEDLINDIAWPAVVKEVKDKIAKVETPIGEMEVKLDLLPDAKVGDKISVHYGYACERVPESIWKKAFEHHKKLGRPKKRRPF